MEHVNFRPVPIPLKGSGQRPVQPPKQSFLQQLHEAEKAAETSLKVSKHATERLEERDIRITESEWKQITEKVCEARKKGVRDSLVLMDQAALIVSAKNATVITAMDRTEAREQIFTNIDGTIVLN